MSEQEESPTRVCRDRHNGSNANLIPRELVLAPTKSFIDAEEDMIRRPLVIGDHDDGARVADLPQMRVLAHLLPSESAVPA